MPFQITPGRILLTFSALGAAVGPYMADWSNTHVFNPRWPPHAKFHNGQTMSMGLCLGLLTLYYTWRDSPGGATGTVNDSKFIAMVTGSLYWVTGLSAICYPGAKGVDPEFGTAWFPQLKVFSVFLGAAVGGGALELWGLGR